ncbi:hypothetical protein OVA24_12185 [Luteolibacter sp. SL250]|uniref:DUF4350 domain-containing protein n=1 Tax=Luteolibacter sp. SL250 TaxID=2995170 RepID=UPI0022721AD5|nr:DUF4350 domain-containing protein [Luteolibacter sp. SL250]WAC17997.1 hypothetical protein OVA24_12185 [Luteolibacter sp. SL250]
MTRHLLRCCLLLFALLSAGCEFEEVTRETGYKGKARLNPWLAAERFVERKGHEVRASGSWLKPEWNHSVYFVPVGVLNNAGVVSPMKEWVSNGGHLVLLVEYSDSEWNDWGHFQRNVPELQSPLVEFLKQTGMTIDRAGSGKPDGTEVTFGEQKYKVETSSSASVSTQSVKDGNFASVEYDYGRVTVIPDARIFRNRKIGDQEHAALLSALIESSPMEGTVVFLRGAGISLWRMLARHLWPVLVGLGVALIIWLWKSFTRFGPMESAATASPLRGYDHHLEALGDYQWRLDRGSALLAPIRERIIEGGQKAAAAAGRKDADFFQFLAERAGIPRERVNRALTENAPADGSVMTRTTADLQKLLSVLRS